MLRIFWERNVYAFIPVIIAPYSCCLFQSFVSLKSIQKDFHYINLLHQNHIGISITENGDPYENALAEEGQWNHQDRVQSAWQSAGFEQTYNQIKKSIKVYNEMRPHTSCDYLTPEQAHLQSEQLAKRWKNYNKRINI